MNALKLWLRSVPEAVALMLLFAVPLMTLKALQAEPDPESPNAIQRDQGGFAHVVRGEGETDALETVEERIERVLPLAPYWPDLHYECLPRDLVSDLRAAGATELELVDVLAVASGRLGRDLTTLTEVSCGSAGFASFPPPRLGLGLTWKGDCAFTDERWRWTVLAVLYSDASAAIQLDVFRRTNGRAIAEGHENGLPRPLAAIMANSGPNRFRRAGERLNWDRAQLVAWYVAGGDGERRKHRVRRWL